MEQVNVTQAVRRLSDLLNRVAYQGASFELTRGGRRIARLVPAGPPKRVRVSDKGSKGGSQLPARQRWQRHQHGSLVNRTYASAQLTRQHS